MILEVDAGRLQAAATPLHEAVAVAQAVHQLRDGIVTDPADAGSPAFHQAATTFLDGWSDAMDALGAHADSLARMLDLVSSSYQDAEDQVAGHARNTASPPLAGSGSAGGS